MKHIIIIDKELDFLRTKHAIAIGDTAEFIGGSQNEKDIFDVGGNPDPGDPGQSPHRSLIMDGKHRRYQRPMHRS